jgi:hypothetical protein
VRNCPCLFQPPSLAIADLRGHHSTAFTLDTPLAVTHAPLRSNWFYLHLVPVACRSRDANEHIRRDAVCVPFAMAVTLGPRRAGVLGDLCMGAVIGSNDVRRGDAQFGPNVLDIVEPRASDSSQREVVGQA